MSHYMKGMSGRLAAQTALEAFNLSYIDRLDQLFSTWKSLICIMISNSSLNDFASLLSHPNWFV